MSMDAMLATDQSASRRATGRIVFRTFHQCPLSQAHFPPCSTILLAEVFLVSSRALPGLGFGAGFQMHGSKTSRLVCN
eukprot:2462657-Amphidinium_carterae.1